MKVSGPSGPSQAGGVGRARPASAGGFAPIAPQEAASEAAGLGGASGVARVSSLDALIALQDIGGPLERRKRAASRGGRLLDALESLKVGLLDGEITTGTAEALARAAREQRELTDDPRLEGVLDEIETRAAVELAKLEMARAAA